MQVFGARQGAIILMLNPQFNFFKLGHESLFFLIIHKGFILIQFASDIVELGFKLVFKFINKFDSLF